MSGSRQCICKLEAGAAALQDAAEQTRSIQLVADKLEALGTVIQDLLDQAD